MGALFATPCVGDLFDCAMRLKCFKHSTRFGAPIRVCQFGYGRVGPTWHTSKMLKSTEHDGVDKFLHIVHLWARAQLPSWFHWCSAQVAQYGTTTPMLPHCHPKDRDKVRDNPPYRAPLSRDKGALTPLSAPLGAPLLLCFQLAP